MQIDKHLVMSYNGASSAQPSKVIDVLSADVSVIGNDMVSNSITNYVLEMAGIDDMIIGGSVGQSQMLTSLRSAGYITIVNHAGRMLRQILPMLHVFGK